MGYQESILHIKKKYQDEFITELSKIYSADWNSLANPDFIIEVKMDMTIDNENRYKIKKGEKLIYIVGERSHQGSIRKFLWDKFNLFKVVRKVLFKYNILSIEECTDFMDEKVLYNIPMLDEITEAENEFIKITKFEIYKHKLIQGDY